MINLKICFFNQRKCRGHTWNCFNIDQSEASIHSLHRKVSDYSDNLNLFQCLESVFRDGLSSPLSLSSLPLNTIKILFMF